MIRKAVPIFIVLTLSNYTLSADAGATGNDQSMLNGSTQNPIESPASSKVQSIPPAPTDNVPPLKSDDKVAESKDDSPAPTDNVPPLKSDDKVAKTDRFLNPSLALADSAYQSPADTAAPKSKHKRQLPPWFVEARAAYFLPTNDRFEDIYSGSGIYGLEIDRHIACSFYGWLAANVFTKEGHTEHDHNHTRLTMVPLGLGVKYIYEKYAFKPYLGLGIAATYLHVHTDGEFMIHSRSNWGIGGIFKVGCLYDFSKRWFIDLFVDYLLSEVTLKGSQKVVSHDANISGFSFGGGIGYRF